MDELWRETDSKFKKDKFCREKKERELVFGHSGAWQKFEINK